MAGKWADSRQVAYGGSIHLVGGVVFALLAIISRGDDRSLMAALAFYALAVGGVWSYMYHRPRIREYLRGRHASRQK